MIRPLILLFSGVKTSRKEKRFWSNANYSVLHWQCFLKLFSIHALCCSGQFCNIAFNATYLEFSVSLTSPSESLIVSGDIEHSLWTQIWVLTIQIPNRVGGIQTSWFNLSPIVTLLINALYCLALEGELLLQNLRRPAPFNNYQIFIRQSRHDNLFLEVAQSFVCSIWVYLNDLTKSSQEAPYSILLGVSSFYSLMTLNHY